MISIPDEYRLDPKVHNAIKQIIEVHIPDWSHAFRVNTATIRDSSGNTRVFCNLPDYIQYLKTAVENLYTMEYITRQQADKYINLLDGCINSNTQFLKRVMEYTPDEMMALAKHYGNKWFLEHPKTVVVHTPGYRVFVTSDNNLGNTESHIRMIGSKGNIITISEPCNDPVVTNTYANSIVRALMRMAPYKQAIIANLADVHETSYSRGYPVELRFVDTNDNYFYLVGYDYLSLFHDN